jgi:UDP-glucuronate 4-epimerase
VVGFHNLLECAQKENIKHFIYASSSSVYGFNEKIPFSENDRVDFPVSMYAATKKSSELMAHTYSHLYKFPTTGLRFFTVYGPWGRPDMAPFLFTKAISEDQTINVFNNGDLFRDFTFIDDIISGVKGVLEAEPGLKEGSDIPFNVFNIGNNEPVSLLDFIQITEKHVGKVAHKNFMPMQPGDVYKTYADIDALKKKVNYSPKINLDQGMNKFVDWYKNFYSK